MDLIKIYERAKEADINIDIRFEPRFGGSITFIGRTIADDYYDTECYSRMFNADEVNYLMIRGEDIIELAMDEIIGNLKPTLDWKKAEEHLQFMIGMYEGCGWTGMFGLKFSLWPLKERLLSGERTRELYDEIMALE